MNKKRANLKDMWNSYMVKGASMSGNDIPICHTTATKAPKTIITYSEAKQIYKEKIVSNKSFKCDSYVCFYEDDKSFDGKNGIWNDPKKARKILKHFEGIIIPDFSTYIDFPKPLMMWNIYRMFAFGYWYGSICGENVIVSARWGFKESYSYCFDGIASNEMIAIGTVGSSLAYSSNRKLFIDGLEELIQRKHPNLIIFYGGLPTYVKQILDKAHIKYFRFRSKTDMRKRGN